MISIEYQCCWYNARPLQITKHREDTCRVLRNINRDIMLLYSAVATLKAHRATPVKAASPREDAYRAVKFQKHLDMVTFNFASWTRTYEPCMTK